MRTKIEVKEIQRTETITETIYVAFDGTEFDKENDCFDYEAEQILKRDDIIVFDSLRDCSPCFFDDYSDHRYIWIKPTTEEACELIEKYYSGDYGATPVHVNHFYGIEFNLDNEPWIIEVKNIMNDIKTFFAGMNIEVTFNERGDK